MAVGGRDEFGNTVTEGGVEVEACIKIFSRALEPEPPVFLAVEVIDRRNGTFEVAHLMKDAGEFEVSFGNCDHNHPPRLTRLNACASIVSDANLLRVQYRIRLKFRVHPHYSPPQHCEPNE